MNLHKKCLHYGSFLLGETQYTEKASRDVVESRDSSF